MENKLPFRWGIKKRTGRAGSQFYHSFEFDKVSYALYDNVYLFKHGDPNPYVGKIVKIWEHDRVKKVKILWFFLPFEIHNYMKDHKVLKNEIFLASGEGIGLADVNPLEALAGKCAVICTSKDERNRQPSPRELAMADYVFYRCFDVGSCTISEQLPDKIAGFEVKFLLNAEEKEQPSSLPAKVTPNPLNEQPSKILRVEAKSGPSAEKPRKSLLRLDSSTLKEDTSTAAVARKLVKPVVHADNTLNVVASLKRKHDDYIGKSSIKPVQKDQNFENENKSGSRAIEVVVPKPESERRKWFKQTPDMLICDAAERDRLVFMQNFDPSYSPSDIEDFIHHAFGVHCKVAFINHPTYDDPNCGKAYLMFRDKEDADRAISEINAGFIVDGRPLLCTKGLLAIPKQSDPFVGHLSFEKTDNIRRLQRQREEQKNAVSTSHCSQPNTMEYDLALEWLVSAEKQHKRLVALHKKHAMEVEGHNKASQNVFNGPKK